eukprot:4917732-Prymnesium_polylepis.1
MPIGYRVKVWTAREWEQETDVAVLRKRGQDLERVAITDLQVLRKAHDDALRQVKKQKERVSALLERLETLEQEKATALNAQAAAEDAEAASPAEAPARQAAKPAHGLSMAQVLKLRTDIATVQKDIGENEAAQKKFDKLVRKPAVCALVVPHSHSLTGTQCVVRAVCGAQEDKMPDEFFQMMAALLEEKELKEFQQALLSSNSSGALHLKALAAQNKKASSFCECVLNYVKKLHQQSDEAAKASSKPIELPDDAAKRKSVVGALAQATTYSRQEEARTESAQLCEALAALTERKDALELQLRPQSRRRGRA